MTSEDAARLVLTVEEARIQLGLSRGLMYEAVRTGQIPSIRIGRRILIPRVGLQQLLEGASAQSAIISGSETKPTDRRR